MKVTIGDITFNVKEIAQYQSIPSSNNYECSCGHVNYRDRNTFDIVGFCSTDDQGFMVVCECVKCFEKYKYHINTTGRYDLEKFKMDLGVLLHLHKYN